MQEFGGVDSPVVLLRQVGLKHLWPDHHMKMWSEHHASSRKPKGARRAHGACHRCFLRRSERIELPLKVTTLDIMTPLVLALDGDTGIFTTTMVVELGLEVYHSGTCRWCMQWGGRVCS
jgi:hypothetical protein